MSEKLTRESLQEWFDTVERINGARPDALAVWAKIEADREATRKETRDELLKDHFAMAEDVEYQFPRGGAWSDGKIGVQSAGRIYADVNVRRPPKKRHLTNTEMAEKLHATDVGELNKELEHLDGDTLKRLCDVLHIPTEVDE